MQQTYRTTNAVACRTRRLPWPRRCARHTWRGPARDPGPVLLAALAVLEFGEVQVTLSWDSEADL
ncbi:MAG: hypothetical protein OXP69_16090, partial [Spirochaetaceae bacterium]|nr:hypothetical protein [Spirochaetaceae bacterium]